MTLHKFVRVPRVSDWAKFAFQISEDEAVTPLLTVGLFIFMSRSPNFENSQYLSNSTEFGTKDIARSEQ